MYQGKAYKLKQTTRFYKVIINLTDANCGSTQNFKFCVLATTFCVLGI